MLQNILEKDGPEGPVSPQQSSLWSILTTASRVAPLDMKKSVKASKLL
jgi:hypothetical protein